MSMNSTVYQLHCKLNSGGFVCGLQLWPSPAAAILVYVWALSEVRTSYSLLLRWS